MFEESNIEQVSKDLKVNFLGNLPFDPKVNRLADKGDIEDYSSPETTEFVSNVRAEVAKMVGMTATPLTWKKEAESH
jgi:hypothetical protein